MAKEDIVLKMVLNIFDKKFLDPYLMSPIVLDDSILCAM